MIFNVKSINTVYIAGKEVDGMKRPREPPTGGNKMNIGRILPTEAAAMFYIHRRVYRQGNGEHRHCSHEKIFDVCMNGDDLEFKKGLVRLQKMQNEYVMQREND